MASLPGIGDSSRNRVLSTARQPKQPVGVLAAQERVDPQLRRSSKRPPSTNEYAEDGAAVVAAPQSLPSRRTRMARVMLVALFVCVGVTARAVDPVNDEVKKLQGEWRAVQIESKGKKA